MAIKSTKYTLKQIDDILGFSLVDGSLEFILEDIQTVTFDNASDVVWATGKDGARLSGWDTNKTATISGNNGSITDGLLAAQVGSDVETISNFIGATISDMFVTADGVTALTNHIAQGTIGNEIGFVYIREEDGSLGTKFEQGATADATHFSYDPATKVITLPTGDVVPANTTLVAFYTPMVSSVKRIRSASDKFSKNVRLIANAFFRDICTEKDYVGQIIFTKAKTEGNFSWAFGDNPAVHNFTFDALTGCGNSDMWDVIIFDTDDIIDEEPTPPTPTDPVQAVGTAAGTEGETSIAVTLSAGTFDAVGGTSTANFNIGGTNGADLGSVTNVDLSAGNTVATLTIQNALGNDSNNYTVTIGGGAYATNVLPIGAPLNVVITNVVVPPTQAVGHALGVELMNEIVVVLTAGTFDATAAANITNWSIGGADGAALGNVTAAVVAGGNTSVTLTVDNALGDDTNTYTVIANASVYAANVTPIAGEIPIAVMND
jgi:hypothetical protein